MSDTNRRWSKGSKATIREDGHGGWRLTTPERKRILISHIFGVDIDQQAVEVTKLSLLLKVLEDETQESLALQLSLFHERALPDLAENIKAGNSLVGLDFVSDDDPTLTAHQRSELNAFDWPLEFPGAAERGGFDAVVTNPPWLMAGYYVKPALPYFRSHYASARGKYDLYYLFIERALSIVAPTGRVGMIVPNKLFHTSAARQLRQTLVDSDRLEEIVDFGDARVFARATNYSCILVMGEHKQRDAATKYSRADAVLTVSEAYDVRPERFGGAIWTFSNTATQEFYERVVAAGRPLADLAEHFGNGVQTGADGIYLVSPERAAELKLENGALRPFLRGRDVRRFAVNPSPAQVVFPYRVADDRFVPLDEAALSAWPNAASYLEANRSTLEKRVWFGKSAAELSGRWYGVMFVDQPAAFAGRHLVTPSLAKRGSFAVNDGALFATGTAGVVSVVLAHGLPETLEYVLALLNSALLTRFAVAHSPVFQGGYHKFSRAYIQALPIRRIDPSVPSDVAAHDALSRLVTERLHLVDGGGGPQTPHDEVVRDRRLLEIDSEIDRRVFDLYGVTSREAEVVAKAERQRLSAPVGRGRLS